MRRHEGEKLGLSRVVKIIAGISIVICAFLTAEVVFFYRILSKSYSPEKTACMVILPEAKERFIEGGRLASAGYAPNFSIIGFDSKKSKVWADKYGFPEAINQIISGKSRSTFEDTLNITKISKEHGFGSILLVTSTYHLPRTSFLLRMLMPEPGIKVNLYGVSSAGVSTLDWKESPTGRKMIFNEMVKFWGGSIELCVYKATGSLISDSTLYLKLKNFVSTWILF